MDRSESKPDIQPQDCLLGATYEHDAYGMDLTILMHNSWKTIVSF